MSVLWIVRAPAVLAVGVAAWLAVKDGGGLDAPPATPRAPAVVGPASSASASPSSAPPTGTDAYEVRQRFVESIGDARYDVPRFATGRAALRAHWRKMQVPWLGLTGDAAARVTSIALLTSDKETQWAMPTSSGKAWAPDARIWNMNEGSFDQRESIFAPTPATVAFRVQVPAHARFTVAPGMVQPAGVPVSFEVAVVDTSGQRRVLHEQVFAPGGPRETGAWADATVDLEAYAGQSVELQMTTTSDGDAPALAVWGNPTLLARGPARTPYNVLWIVVDALRPDVLASFHDDAEDAKKKSAPVAPLEAWLPKVPGLTPVIDELASHAVRFPHAYSAGSWTRPGTLAMLSGARSTELGVATLPWWLEDAALDRYYASSPPLLPLLLRRAGVTTRAFVNNYFMVGYAPVGIDMGFERVDDHRFRTRDTLTITESAVSFLKAHGDERFFLFCNFNSPHEPWEPPAAMLARVPPPPAGPADDITRRYMAEAGKDDEAIGVLLRALDEAHQRDHTLVIVTADHGETLSAAHAGISLLDTMKVRYHHAVSNYEETSRIPILLSLPKVLDAGTAVTARVRNTDIAPTVLELEGLEAPSRMSGRSLLPLARGVVEPDARVVVTEGRGTRALLAGKYRLLLREGKAQVTKQADGTEETVAEELYDLETDPGERHNLARSQPDVVLEMRARLRAALKNVPAADAKAAIAPPDPSVVAPLQLRFAGGGAARRVSGKLRMASGTKAAITPVGLATDAFRITAGAVELSFETAPDAVVGLDVTLTPSGAACTWELFLDDAPWPASSVFAGPFGLAAKGAARGLTTDDARAEIAASRPPVIDAQRDVGLFVTRARGGALHASEGREGAGDGDGARTREMSRLLQEWGYAHGSGAAGSGPSKAADARPKK